MAQKTQDQTSRLGNLPFAIFLTSVCFSPPTERHSLNYITLSVTFSCLFMRQTESESLKPLSVAINSKRIRSAYVRKTVKNEHPQPIRAQF